MKRLKLKRWKSDFSKKRKLLIALILITMTSLGVGYAYLVTELNINGNIVVKEYNAPTLYNVLRNEALSGGLAKEYTGNHNDSIDPSLSTEKIYHYYANGNSDQSKIIGKNNVIFGGYCWYLLRTTDTGGTKLLYNGAAVNNQCIEKGPSTYFTTSTYSTSLNNTYWYGTDYEYNTITHKYTLKGETNQYGPLNETTSSDIVGKYTCLSSTLEECPDELKYVISYDSGSYAYVASVYNSSSNHIANAAFNVERDSIADGGYMYGDLVKEQSFNDDNHFANLPTARNYMFYDTTLGSNSSFYVADDVTYDTTTSKYSLVNPVLNNTYSNINDLVGKYTFFINSDSYNNSTINYIFEANQENNSLKYTGLKQGATTFVNLYMGDSVNDNGDGTYTINNAVSVDLSEWINNYDNYNNKYYCKGNATCNNPRYVMATSEVILTDCDSNSKIVVAKGYDEGQLQDTLLLPLYEFIGNYENYEDYPYTCGTDSPSCTIDQVQVIDGLGNYGSTYTYRGYYYLGDGVTWDGTEYTLTNVKDNRGADTHRYMCPEKGKKKCTTAAYIINPLDKSYLPLENGKTTLQDILNSAFANNIHDSEIKKLIDAWYKRNLFDYSEYLEDTIYCNNRSIAKYGAFAPLGNASDLLQFYGALSDYDYDLSCPLVTDQFAVGNEQAKLTYKVGMATYPEMNIMINPYFGGDYYSNFRVMTPQHYHMKRIYTRMSSRGSSLSAWYTEEVRPVISLKKGVQYTAGDGSLSKPYYIGESHTITVDSNLFNYPKNSIEGWKVYIKSDDYFVTSFKLNGELIEGESFTMPDEDVTITDITYIPANYTIINTDNTVTVPSTGRYNTTITLDAGNSYGVSSFKLNGTVVEGNSFTMPAENVTITDVVKFEQITVESEHNPYPNSLNNVIYYENTFEDAMALKVELTYQTQYYDDCIYIYDSPNGSAIGGGRYSSYKKTDIININGNYVKIIFRTNDEDNDYYGFMAKITPIYPHNITNTNSLFNVENRALTGTTLNITSDDYIVTSFKLNGELIEGESFTMPNEDVTITDITYIPANYTITNTDNTVTVPSTGRYKTTITLVASSDYRVTSFKMNGELITGNSFTMPAENVTITDITKSSYIMVESEHDPYLNNENNTVYFERTFEGATSISVELTYQTEGVSWDWVYLYGSSNGSPINDKKYGGSTKTTETIIVNSNYLKIVFKTDNTINNYYGFKAVITPNYS